MTGAPMDVAIWSPWVGPLKVQKVAWNEVLGLILAYRAYTESAVNHRTTLQIGPYIYTDAPELIVRDWLAGLDETTLVTVVTALGPLDVPHNYHKFINKSDIINGAQALSRIVPVIGRYGLRPPLAGSTLLDVLSEIKTIEGPISMEVLVPTDQLTMELGRPGPVLLLLGDYHSVAGRCPVCATTEGCYSLYTGSLLRYLDRAIRKLGLSADLFLEYWLAPDEYHELPGSDESSLVWTQHYTTECLPFRSAEDRARCPLKHIRVHMGDLRRYLAHESNKYQADNIYGWSAKLNPAEFKRRCRMAFPDVPQAHIDRLVSEFFEDDTLDPNDKVQRFWLDPFFERYSMLHRELAYLPESLATALIRQLSTPNRFFNEDGRWNETAARAHERAHGPYVSYTPINDSNYLELYALARLFKTPRAPGRPSQFGIMYLGRKHVGNIAQALITEGYYTRHSFDGTDKPRDARELKKCIRRTRPKK